MDIKDKEKNIVQDVKGKTLNIKKNILINDG